VKLAIPEKLTDEQREAVEKLAEALDGANPRADLLHAARSGAGGRVED
jgi:hypothetical protein